MSSPPFDPRFALVQAVPDVDRSAHPSCFGDGTGNALYFLGFVGVLTNYNAKKKAAHAAKSAKHGAVRRGAKSLISLLRFVSELCVFFTYRGPNSQP